MARSFIGPEICCVAQHRGLTMRWSQPGLAPSVPLSRFTSSGPGWLSLVVRPPDTHPHMENIKLILILALAGVIPSRPGFAGPASVGGDAFILVATNASGIQLFGLVADADGKIYVGNNGNGSAIPLQRFSPAAFAGMPIGFDSFGPVCSDGDGLAFGGGSIFVSDLSSGVRRIPVDGGPASIFTVDTGLGIFGSPLWYRPSDGNVFGAEGGLGSGNPLIQEFDANGNLVTNHATGTEIETMTYDDQSGIIYYAPYSTLGTVRAYNPVLGTDTLLA